MKHFQDLNFILLLLFYIKFGLNVAADEKFEYKPSPWSSLTKQKSLGKTKGKDRHKLTPVYANSQFNNVGLPLPLAPWLNLGEGISRRKNKNKGTHLPITAMPNKKQHGVKTTEDENKKSEVPLLTNSSRVNIGSASRNKQRNEGKTLQQGFMKQQNLKMLAIQSGRIGNPSPKIAQRFFNRSSLADKSAQQIEVQPSPVSNETLLQDLPTAVLDAARIGSLLDQIQHGDKSTILVPGRIPRLYSGGPSAHFMAKTGHNSTQEKTGRLSPSLVNDDDNFLVDRVVSMGPAFCRRCFQFWRKLAGAHVSHSTIFEYCCTTGHKKSRLFLHTGKETSKGAADNEIQEQIF
ncbi:hypothetical protein Ddc_18158 [Ditylenchus destructor]|nr:hypothetical protein Ddc_18158 [Ditylenchus destructor]